MDMTDKHNFNDIVKNGPKKYAGSKVNFDDWFYKTEKILKNQCKKNLCL